MRAIAIAGVMAVSLMATACTGPIISTPSAAPTSDASTCPDGTTANEQFCFSDDPIAEQLAEIVRAAYEADDLGAVIAGVWHDGEPVMVGAVGESMTSVPATIDMHHRLGNLAWPMLTTLVLQQVDAGVFALDDTLSTWFPEMPGSDQVTVKMLLQNTSGYQHYTEVQAFLEALWADPFRQWVLDDVIAYGVQDGPKFVPGTEWNFSDTNGLLMIKVLEAATGQPVLDLMHEGVWEPLGMHDTTPPLDSVQAEPVLHGYSDERGFWEDVSFWNPTWTSFVGGPASNQEDVRTFLDALGSGELLSDELHELQLAPELAGDRSVDLGKVLGTRHAGRQRLDVHESGALRLFRRRRDTAGRGLDHGRLHDDQSDRGPGVSNRRPTSSRTSPRSSRRTTSWTSRACRGPRARNRVRAGRPWMCWRPRRRRSDDCGEGPCQLWGA